MGRISIVDLMIGAAVLSLLVCILQFGGTLIHHRDLMVYQVLPNPVISGEGKPVSIRGTGFSNGCTVQWGSSPAVSGRFINEVVLEVDAPEGLEPGSYSVRVRDPMGRFAQLPGEIQIRWNPRIERLEPRRTYPGEQVLIHGRYFDAYPVVRLGNIPLHPQGRETSSSLPVKLEADVPILPGIYDVTVSNPNGGTQTFPRAIEVLPKPQVTRVYPDIVTYGEQVTLTIEGENLPRDAAFYLEDGKRKLENLVWISPEHIEARLTVEPGMGKWHSLWLKIPDGVSIVVKPRAVYVAKGLPVALLVNLDVKGADPAALEALEQMPESRVVDQTIKLVLQQNPPPDPNVNRKNSMKLQVNEERVNPEPVGFWVILWGEGRVNYAGEGKSLLYRGSPMKIGKPITVNLFGHELTGILLQQPIPIGTGDEWRKAVTDGHS